MYLSRNYTNYLHFFLSCSVQEAVWAQCLHQMVVLPQVLQLWGGDSAAAAASVPPQPPSGPLWVLPGGGRPCASLQIALPGAGTKTGTGARTHWRPDPRHLQRGRPRLQLHGGRGGEGVTGPHPRRHPGGGPASRRPADPFQDPKAPPEPSAHQHTLTCHMWCLMQFLCCTVPY